jgi:hypothetical protein
MHRKVVINQYGDKAADHAAKLSKEMAAKQDAVGYTMWALLRQAFGELQVRDQPGETTIH